MARIVVCESSPELRHLFVRTLARLGHEPTIVQDAPAEIDGADAVLVDVDGEELADDAAGLRARAPEVPVIVCSIYPRDERSDAFGPVAHLLKPFTRLDLDRAIGDALSPQLGTMAPCPTASASTATSA